MGRLVQRARTGGMVGAAALAALWHAAWWSWAAWSASAAAPARRVSAPPVPLSFSVFNTAADGNADAARAVRSPILFSLPTLHGFSGRAAGSGDLQAPVRLPPPAPARWPVAPPPAEKPPAPAWTPLPVAGPPPAAAPASPPVSWSFGGWTAAEFSRPPAPLPPEALGATGWTARAWMSFDARGVPEQTLLNAPELPAAACAPLIRALRDARLAGKTVARQGWIGVEYHPPSAP